MHNLIYVIDTYCGWCYGFGPAIRELAAQEDVTVTVRHGALFSGDRSAPVGSFPHIPGANARISELTGVTFGSGYQDMLADGSTVMNSDDAARGLAALRSVAENHQDLTLVSGMQQAFYTHGKSLSDVETYRWITEELRLDADATAAAFTDPAVAQAACQEQEWVSAAGASHYPTLLVETSRGLVEVGSPTDSADQLRAAVENA